MNSVQVCLICNALTKICGFICITLAAMHFERVSILWFYLILLIVGSEVQTTKETTREANNHE